VKGWGERLVDKGNPVEGWGGVKEEGGECWRGGRCYSAVVVTTALFSRFAV
jgi:hypothetical protein